MTSKMRVSIVMTWINPWKNYLSQLSSQNTNQCIIGIVTNGSNRRLRLTTLNSLTNKIKITTCQNVANTMSYASRLDFI
ncbi:Uncharacterized protein APZ42_018935 [Daphnia magna]|uniref:Uncharacterized protein n=1 Tax=Daphnia magna TaxID=35525 RepID=A0A164YXQ2_9CRUS|nr:Uncharacterized protein APZ42_018935 [Daphnia magna]